MSNRYSFVTKSTGNKANIRPVATRAEARDVKRNKSFRVSIWDNVTQQFVR